jgi:threonine dehydratase
MTTTPNIPELGDIQRAHRRIEKQVLNTPVERPPELERLLGCQLWLKCDHLQPTGAFKLRGASNAVACLEERGIPGDVATHSSGNHGAALAWAARAAGRRARVVMPENAVPAKIDAVRRFGGEVLLCAPGQAPREAGLAELVSQGCIPVPPYDHPDIIAGQGTAALELLEAAPDLDVLVTPVGGGGLLAGCAIAAQGIKPGIQIIGAEPAGAADTAASLERGARVAAWEPDTVADGLRALVGVSNFAVIEERVRAVLLADDEAIIAAMRLALETAGLRLEPSAAVALAVIREHPEVFAGRRVGVVLTGGNIDFGRFPWLAPETEKDTGNDPGT